MTQELQDRPAEAAQRPPMSPAELMAHVAAASPEMQTMIAQQLAFMQGAKNNEVAAQVTQALGVQVPVSKELTPQQAKELGIHIEQQTAVESTVALTAKANSLAGQGLDEGNIKRELTSAGASASVAQNFAQVGVQQHQQTERAETLAVQRAEDMEHREKIGLAEPEPTKTAHQFAGLLDKSLLASIGAAMGGAQHGHDAEVQVASGGKSGPDTQQGRA